MAQYSKFTITLLFINHILHDFSAFVQFSTSTVRMSEGTFCRVAVHVYMYISRLISHVNIVIRIKKLYTKQNNKRNYRSPRIFEFKGKTMIMF